MDPPHSLYSLEIAPKSRGWVDFSILFLAIQTVI